MAKDILYVRGISPENIEFLGKITKEKGFVRIHKYLNALLDRQRLNYENRKKQIKAKKTVRKKLR